MLISLPALGFFDHGLYSSLGLTPDGFCLFSGLVLV